MREASAPEWPDTDWMRSGVILAVYEHRRRIAQLLARFDAARLSSIEAEVSALLDGTLDAASLVARMSDGVRPGDGRMRQLVDLLAPGPLGDGFERRDQGSSSRGSKTTEASTSPTDERGERTWQRP